MSDRLPPIAPFQIPDFVGQYQQNQLVAQQQRANQQREQLTQQEITGRQATLTDQQTAREQAGQVKAIFARRGTDLMGAATDLEGLGLAEEAQRVRTMAADSDKRRTDWVATHLLDVKGEGDFTGFKVIAAHQGFNLSDAPATYAEAKASGWIDQQIEAARSFQEKYTTLHPAKNITSVPAGGSVIDTNAPAGTPPIFTAPPDPAKAETERHNREQERISGLTAGREVAAQQETARHNRATEAAAAQAANPLGPMTTPGAAPPSTGPTTPSANGRNEDALAKYTPPIRDQVKAIVEGRRTLDARMASTPYGRALINAAYEYDPSFDQVNYNARAKTRADFTSGKSAAEITALNTVIGHLDDLSKAADALNNTWSPTWNSIANAASTAGGDPRVKQFNTLANGVADEATRVWRQSGGTESDIRTWKEQLAAAGSPEQIHGVIATIGDMLNSKLDAKQAQHDQGMGTSAIKMITPKAATVLDRLRQKAGLPATAGSGASGPKDGDVQPITDPGYPPGAQKQFTNGKWVRIK